MYLRTTNYANCPDFPFSMYSNSCNFVLKFLSPLCSESVPKGQSTRIILLQV